jgi:hypothetical protein
VCLEWPQALPFNEVKVGRVKSQVESGGEFVGVKIQRLSSIKVLDVRGGGPNPADKTCQCVSGTISDCSWLIVLLFCFSSITVYTRHTSRVTGHRVKLSWAPCDDYLMAPYDDDEILTGFCSMMVFAASTLKLLNR